MRKSQHWPDISRSCPTSSPQCGPEFIMHSWSAFVTDSVASVLERTCLRFIGAYFNVRTSVPFPPGFRLCSSDATKTASA